MGASAAVSAGMQGGSMIGSAIAAQGNMTRSIAGAKSQERVAKLTHSRTMQNIEMQDRDIRADGARFMSKMRNFIATSGAAGTASAHALRSAGAGEIGRQLGRLDISRQRSEQDLDMRIDNLRGVQRVLKKRQNFHLFNSVTGLAGGLLTNVSEGLGQGVALPPVTSLARPLPDAPQVAPEAGVSSRRNIGTSKRGGIGGF